LSQIDINRLGIPAMALLDASGKLLGISTGYKNETSAATSPALKSGRISRQHALSANAAEPRRVLI
jgi:hypothetical protein